MVEPPASRPSAPAAWSAASAAAARPSTYGESGGIVIRSDDGEAAAVAVHERGLKPESVLVRRSSLEDVFLRLTGRSLID